MTTRLTMIVGGISIMAIMFAPSSMADDNLMQKRFGVTRSEPVYDGYLFVAGRYVDAPYVIEQRGVGLFINGYRCGRLVGNRVFPGEYQTPLYVDPGMPDGIDADTSLAQTIFHRVSKKKIQHWATMELSDDQFAKIHADYFTPLPNIADVVTRDSHCSRYYEVSIKHNDGTTWTMRYRKTGKITRRLPAYPGSEMIMVRALNNWHSAVKNFSDQRLLIVSEEGEAQWKREPSAGWAAVMAVLGSDRAVTDKIVQLHTLGFISDDELTNAPEKMGELLTDFEATAQLHQRLAGDDAWIKTAREKTELLPSGLVQMPAFADRYVPDPEPLLDDLGQNRLGWRRSEPIVSGYLFVDGQYVDPPYVVEQRGYGIIINGYLCEKSPHQALIFANYPKAQAEAAPSWGDPMETDQRKTWFGTPLLLEGEESSHRLYERVMRLYEWVRDYLEADGFVIVEQSRLRALHNEHWQRAWHGRLFEHFLPRDPPNERRVNNPIAAKARVEAMRDLFVPGFGALREKDAQEAAFDAAVGRYGSFVLNHLKLTPGFWKRLAGGSVWEKYLHDTMPQGPFGVVQEPIIPR